LNGCNSYTKDEIQITNDFRKMKSITQVTCSDLETYNASLSHMSKLPFISIYGRGVQTFLPNVSCRNHHVLFSLSDVQMNDCRIVNRHCDC